MAKEIIAEKTVKYISKYLNLRLIDKSSYSKEIEGRIVVVPGKSIQFAEGVYETEDPNEIKFLDNHPNCGNVFIKVKAADLQKARKEQFKDLETKEAELKAKKEKTEKKGKALAEGEGMPKKKGSKGKDADEDEEEDEEDVDEGEEKDEDEDENPNF